MTFDRALRIFYWLVFVGAVCAGGYELRVIAAQYKFQGQISLNSLIFCGKAFALAMFIYCFLIDTAWLEKRNRKENWRP